MVLAFADDDEAFAAADGVEKRTRAELDSAIDLRVRRDSSLVVVEWTGSLSDFID